MVANLLIFFACTQFILDTAVCSETDAVCIDHFWNVARRCLSMHIT